MDNAHRNIEKYTTDAGRINSAVDEQLPKMDAAWALTMANMRSDTKQNNPSSSSSQHDGGSCIIDDFASEHNDQPAASSSSALVHVSAIISMKDIVGEQMSKDTSGLMRQPPRKDQPEVRNLKRGSAELARSAAATEETKKMALKDPREN